MPTYVLDRHVVTPAGQPSSGTLLALTEDDRVAYGHLHEGCKLAAFLSPDEAEVHGVRLIQLAAAARTAAEVRRTVSNGASRIVT